MHSPTPPAALHFAPTSCKLAAPSLQITDTSTSPFVACDNIAGSFDIAQRGRLRRRSRFATVAFRTRGPWGTCRSGKTCCSSRTCLARRTRRTGLAAIPFCSRCTGRPDLAPNTLRTRRPLQSGLALRPSGTGRSGRTLRAAGPLLTGYALRPGRPRRSRVALPGGLGTSGQKDRGRQYDQDADVTHCDAPNTRGRLSGYRHPSRQHMWSLGRSPPGEVRRQFCSEPNATGKPAGG